MSCGAAKCSFQINLREAIVDQLPAFSPSSIILNCPKVPPTPTPTIQKPLQFWNTANNSICGNFSTPSKVAQLRSVDVC